MYEALERPEWEKLSGNKFTRREESVDRDEKCWRLECESSDIASQEPNFWRRQEDIDRKDQGCPKREGDLEFKEEDGRRSR